MRSTLLPALVATLLLGAPAGCINSNSARGVEPRWEELGPEAFVRGRTTRAEVLERLGPPSQVLDLAEGTAFYYLLETTHARGVILLVYNDRGERTRYSRAVFFFDGEGTLTDFALSRGDG